MKGGITEETDLTGFVTEKEGHQMGKSCVNQGSTQKRRRGRGAGGKLDWLWSN